jgi:hypothetical protein
MENTPFDARIEKLLERQESLTTSVEKITTQFSNMIARMEALLRASISNTEAIAALIKVMQLDKGLGGPEENN